jgi:hypothetical protein
MGTIKEISSVALFLTTKDSEFINGEVIKVDGSHRFYKDHIPKVIYEQISKNRKSKL